MTTHLTDTQKQTIRIALAKFHGCDVQNFFEDGDGTIFTLDEWSNIVEAPNYLISLNDCHEIEVKLTDEQFEEYHRHLWVTTDIIHSQNSSRALISASAEQRALALYRALKLGELGD